MYLKYNFILEFKRFQTTQQVPIIFFPGRGTLSLKNNKIYIYTFIEKRCV